MRAQTTHRCGWRSECRAEEVETGTKAVLSKKMVVNTRAGSSTHDQLRRQRVLRWWGCLFNFTGSEERGDVERVSEEERREGDGRAWIRGDGREGVLSHISRLAWWRCRVWVPHPQRRENRAWSVSEGVNSGHYSAELGHWRGAHSFREVLHFWRSLFSCVPLLSLPTLHVHIFVIFSVWLCRCLLEFWKAMWETTNFRIVVWMTGLMVSFGNSMRPGLFKSLAWKGVRILVLSFSVAHDCLSNVCSFTQLAPVLRSKGQSFSALNSMYVGWSEVPKAQCRSHSL